MQKKLRSLKTKSPKDYWKILNTVDKKHKNENIDLDSLYTFFKNLNEQRDTNDDQSMEDLHFSLNENNEILNAHINDAEILKCIKSLKNNKACSNDNIINEYIKTASDIMLPLYNCFFNLVLDTGILPDSWLEGSLSLFTKTKVIPSSRKITDQ